MDDTLPTGTLQRFPPAPALRGLVSHYWLSQGGGSGGHTILPDGCVDLVLRLDQDDGDLSAFGSTTRPATVAVSTASRYFGIRFQPGQSRHFLPVPGRLLTDTVYPLDPPAGLQPERLAERITAPEPTQAVDRLLRHWLAKHPPDRHRLDGALTLLSQPGRAATVTGLAERLNLSRRQLERDFLEWVGMPPKMFIGIRRSQWAGALLSRRPSGATLADIALITGYADQSHMTRALKRYLGITPGAPRLADHDVAFIQEQVAWPD